MTLAPGTFQKHPFNTLAAQALSDAGRSAMHVVAGAIEWYSWRESTLVATGWERTAAGARDKGMAQWRNCSPTGSGWTAESGPPVEAGFDRMRHDKCFGPLPFFKGRPWPWK